jgi:hypothetical protein
MKNNINKSKKKYRKKISGGRDGAGHPGTFSLSEKKNLVESVKTIIGRLTSIEEHCRKNSATSAIMLLLLRGLGTQTVAAREGYGAGQIERAEVGPEVGTPSSLESAMELGRAAVARARTGTMHTNPFL